MTYSISFTGVTAGATYPQKVFLDDTLAGTPGNQALAMAQNPPFLGKGPDGAQTYYTIDAERSRPGGPIYLLKLSG